jgi:hypothetical protein
VLMNGVRANDVPRNILAARIDHTPKVRPFGPVFPTTRCPGDDVRKIVVSVCPTDLR